MSLASYPLTLPSRAMVVSDLMSTVLVTAPPELPLDEALHLMLREHVRHLLVFAGHRLVGIVGDRDLAAHRGLNHGSAPIPVGEIACPPRCVCTPSTPLGVVASDMLACRCDAAVVQRDDHVVGLFTAVDALRCLAS